jgi:sugar (pentulose or hexulose) kinase
MFSTNMNEDSLTHAELDEEAAYISPGADGFVALKTFQGSRTPNTDPLARVALVGLSLIHTREHIWRALLESVCFVTRASVEALADAGHVAKKIILAGGSTPSPLWLQMHANVIGLPVVIRQNSDNPVLGCAILASVGGGIFTNAQEAVQHMVRDSQIIHRSPQAHALYNELHTKVYRKNHGAASPVVRAISEL